MTTTALCAQKGHYSGETLPVNARRGTSMLTQRREDAKEAAKDSTWSPAGFAPFAPSREKSSRTLKHLESVFPQRLRQALVSTGHKTRSCLGHVKKLSGLTSRLL